MNDKIINDFVKKSLELEVKLIGQIFKSITGNEFDMATDKSRIRISIPNYSKEWYLLEIDGITVGKIIKSYMNEEFQFDMSDKWEIRFEPITPTFSINKN